jgi:hypothetical protein
MTEREQVIAELMYLKRDCLEGSATDDTLNKAIALIKAQEPRVMTLDEIIGKKIIEYKYAGADDGSFPTGIAIEEYQLNAVVVVHGYGNQDKDTECVEFACDSDDPEDVVWFPTNGYGVKWRCWTDHPTDEQRKAIQWAKEANDGAHTERL